MIPMLFQSFSRIHFLICSKDKDGGLQGSNWYDSSDKGLTTGDNANTLVKALADAGVFDGDETATATLTVDGVDITITFSVSE